jgi:hypothetical protein
MIVPQVGQASSGNSRPRFLAFALVWVVIAKLLVKRDHHAVRPKHDLYVEHDFGDPGLEDE